MAIEEIMKCLLVADKATLAKVAGVLTHKDQSSETHPARETQLILQKEAARRLSISTTSVWRLIREKKLEVVNVRGRNRVRLASLMDFALGKER